MSDSLANIPLPQLTLALERARQETGSTNQEPVQINDAPAVCGMPLILFMALDAAIKKGKITVEQALDLIKGLKDKGDNDA